MFLAREKELSILHAQFTQEEKTAVLVYGKRRIGKSTLILEASKGFDGTVINHLCIQSTLEGNLVMLSRSICLALGLPILQFNSLPDIFDFLGRQPQKILLILDEYQYLKNTQKKNAIDSLMQGMIDTMPGNIKLVLCGSYISIMRELLEEENPLFGRFSCILHVNGLDYFDAASFYPNLDARNKIENYAVFGGSPYVLNAIKGNPSIARNIKEFLLPTTGILRSYIENILLREIQKAYDIRIFEIIGNGKKRYSDLESKLSGSSGLLDKQLKNLLEMDAIQKVFPINKPNDKKKQFYTMQDNLMRFYFTYIFGNEGVIERLGPDAFYDLYVSPSLSEFISRRFEEIVNQYFERRIKQGKMKNVFDIGSFWYDDPQTKTNGEFDCVIKTSSGYEFYECKFYQNPMSAEECQKEIAQLNNLKGISFNKASFVCSAGFSFDSKDYILITGDDLFIE